MTIVIVSISLTLYILSSFGNNALTAGADYMNDYLLTYQFVSGETHSQSSVDAFVQFDYNPLSWLNIVASVLRIIFRIKKQFGLSPTCHYVQIQPFFSEG